MEKKKRKPEIIYEKKCKTKIGGMLMYVVRVVREDIHGVNIYNLERADHNDTMGNPIFELFCFKDINLDFSWLSGHEGKINALKMISEIYNIIIKDDKKKIKK